MLYIWDGLFIKHVMHGWNCCLCSQMKKPNNVLTNLTLAMEEKAADMPVKLTTMLFRLDHADKAANFVSVVEDAKLK